MSKILGYFVFKSLGDGCLVAKYSNLGLSSPLTECAKRINEEEATDVYLGEFTALWIDDPSSKKLKDIAGNAILKIEHKSGTSGTYQLKWNDGKSFSGEAMLFDGLLVGSYWNNELDAVVRTNVGNIAS